MVDQGEVLALVIAGDVRHIAFIEAEDTGMTQLFVLLNPHGHGPPAMVFASIDGTVKAKQLVQPIAGVLAE